MKKGEKHTIDQPKKKQSETKTRSVISDLRKEIVVGIKLTVRRSVHIYISIFRKLR